MQDWVHYFDTIFNETGLTTRFTDDTIVIVQTPNYFSNISEFVFDDG